MSGSNAGVNGATASITGKGAQPVYVIDFSVYKPPKECDFSMYEILEYLLSPTGRKHGYHPDTIDFILRIAERSGEHADVNDSDQLSALMGCRLQAGDVGMTALTQKQILVHR
jgi:hypothetical protein